MGKRKGKGEDVNLLLNSLGDLRTKEAKNAKDQILKYKAHGHHAKLSILQAIHSKFPECTPIKALEHCDVDEIIPDVHDYVKDAHCLCGANLTRKAVSVDT